MKINIKSFLGIIFVSFGFLFLLQSLNLLTGTIGNIIWMAVMGGGSVFFFTLYAKQKSRYFWLISGIFFLSIAAGNLVGLLNLPTWLQDGVLFAGMGISFILIYIFDNLNWWALIPGGLIISLGVIRILEQTSPATGTDGILFYGLGSTFLLLFFIPTRYGRLKWALIPGTALVGIGFLFNFSSAGDVVGYIGPSLLVLAGILVLYFAARRQKAS